MGANHVVRGVNWTGVFDLGSLLSETAALRGGQSLHVLVGALHGTHGTITPDLGLAPTEARMLGELAFLLEGQPTDGLYLVDLRPLRPLASGTGRLKALNSPDAVRIIHGFDFLLVWNGTGATEPLLAD